MSSLKKTALLFIVLHIYIGLSALIFQHLEYQERQQKITNKENAISKLANTCNLTKEKAASIINRALTSEIVDRDDDMRESWNSFPSAVWFVMTLFTTVGESS